MQLAIKGINVTIPDAEVSRLVLERLQGTAPAVAASVSSTLKPPRIGGAWPEQGGFYAGVVAGEVAGLDRDYHLIIGRDLDPASHGDQIAASKACTDCDFTDWDLPYRKEQRIQFCNAQSLFKAESYWSKETHASGSSDAWNQVFGSGSQLDWDKLTELRGRLVRRLSI